MTERSRVLYIILRTYLLEATSDGSVHFRLVCMRPLKARSAASPGVASFRGECAAFLLWLESARGVGDEAAPSRKCLMRVGPGCEQARILPKHLTSQLTLHPPNQETNSSAEYSLATGLETRQAFTSAKQRQPQSLAAPRPSTRDTRRFSYWILTGD